MHEIKTHSIAQLVETLRRSSGLFAEVGDGLYCFANQAFQVYFAALYLISKSQEERRELAAKRFLSNKWSEPLLLMLMYKSALNNRDEQREIVGQQVAERDWSERMHEARRELIARVIGRHRGHAANP